MRKGNDWCSSISTILRHGSSQIQRELLNIVSKIDRILLQMLRAQKEPIMRQHGFAMRIVTIYCTDMFPYTLMYTQYKKSATDVKNSNNTQNKIWISHRRLQYLADTSLEGAASDPNRFRGSRRWKKVAKNGPPSRIICGQTVIDSKLISFGETLPPPKSTNPKRLGSLAEPSDGEIWTYFSVYER